MLLSDKAHFIMKLETRFEVIGYFLSEEFCKILMGGIGRAWNILEFHGCSNIMVVWIF